MQTSAPPAPPRDPLAWAARRWIVLVTLAWVVGAAFMLYAKWGGIRWFSLSDTDDNMRMMQVRALLAGQGWYDLRNYRMDPPRGASIHWTRLVDLPIAGLILLGRLFVANPAAERFAAALAPILPLWVALVAASLIARRLVGQWGFVFAVALVYCCQASLLMFMPLRIDHHGWQLAFLMLALAGAVDFAPARGGVVAGLAGAASLTIGLEMLPYIALTTGAVALRWVADPAERMRLRAYGLSLGGGALAGFALFASYDNRALVCDVLSPVYLTVAMLGGALFVALAAAPVRSWPARLALAVGAAAVLGAVFALAFPQCLGRPERLSPELERLWFNNVREAKPLYAQAWRLALSIVALPVAGVVGAGLAAWRARGSERFAGWATVLLLAAFSCGLLCWQTRAGPAAQLLAVPGATWLAAMILPPLLDSERFLVRVGGALAAFLLLSGTGVTMLLQAFPEAPPKPGRRAVNLANAKCPTLPALAPIARLPKTTILTFVDLGPRLVTVTHHDAIAGPYHRNGAAILDIHHAFRSASPATALDVMRRHGATLLLLCPGMSESTIYRAQNPHGFYVQLTHGEVPAWLAPVPLPKGSPFRLWRLIA